MDFEKELQALCEEVEGARSAMVMSFDGISVAGHNARDGDLDTEALLIEMIGPLKQAAQAMGSVDAGNLNTLELGTPRGTLLLNLLNEEYFVAVFLDPDALVGQGRYAMRQHSLPLTLELV